MAKLVKHELLYLLSRTRIPLGTFFDKPIFIFTLFSFVRKNKQTDRQTDKQTNRQTDKVTSSLLELLVAAKNHDVNS